MHQSMKWDKSNQEYLDECIGQISMLLESYSSPKNEDVSSARKKKSAYKKKLPKWRGEYHSALDTLCRLFGLSSFERSILLLCAGVELYGEFSRLCAKAHGNLTASYATFGLALAIFPDPHWSALTPASPLRRFRLIEFHSSLPAPLTSSPIRIEERVLHYLTGISYLEPTLDGIIRPAVSNTKLLPQSHMNLVEQIVISCNNIAERAMPIIQLWGANHNSKLTVALRVCRELELNLWYMSGDVLEKYGDNEVESFVKLWIREAALLGSGLYISAEELAPPLQKTITRIISKLPSPVFLGTQDRWHISTRPHLSFEVNKPTKVEQFHLWKTCMGEKEPSEDISSLINQFDFSASAIVSAYSEAKLLSKNNVNLTTLWNICRRVTRHKMTELTQQVLSKATIDDLVLPEEEKHLLREIIAHVKYRTKVYEEWGFGISSGRGMGITTLFSGATGTGKSMAAEVLANELNLDLFRIDLSAVVSKYIGETEKNLRRVFDAADEGGVILFFDEADALFGKRTEVRESHDRLANIEISYLLTRMENFRGLSILATNMKNAIDTAFMRRIRFSVNFPFPDEKSREEIWKKTFPSQTPIDGVDFHALSRLNISGGSIRNIALNAAVLAADERVSVSMKHLKRASQIEYAKSERHFGETEIRGGGGNS